MLPYIRPNATKERHAQHMTMPLVGRIWLVNIAHCDVGDAKVDAPAALYGPPRAGLIVDMFAIAWGQGGCSKEGSSGRGRS